MHIYLYGQSNPRVFRQSQKQEQRMTDMHIARTTLPLFGKKITVPSAHRYETKNQDSVLKPNWDREVRQPRISNSKPNHQNACRSELTCLALH
jgi:hypothetical protein